MPSQGPPGREKLNFSPCLWKVLPYMNSIFIWLVRKALNAISNIKMKLNLLCKFYEKDYYCDLTVFKTPKSKFRDLSFSTSFKKSLKL